MNDKQEKGAMQVDVALVRELAALLDDTHLTEIEVEDGDRKIRVARKAGGGAPIYAPSFAPAPAAQSPFTYQGELFDPGRRDVQHVAAKDQPAEADDQHHEGAGSEEDAGGADTGENALDARDGRCMDGHLRIFLCGEGCPAAARKAGRRAGRQSALRNRLTRSVRPGLAARNFS